MTFRTRSVNLSCITPRPSECPPHRGTSAAISSLRVSLRLSLGGGQTLAHELGTDDIALAGRQLGARITLQMTGLSQDEQLIHHSQRAQPGHTQRRAESYRGA